jgi:enhancer of mRNA-decapping protein 4
MSTVLRELLTTQKNEINSLILQHVRQQQSVTPKPQPTVVSSPNPTLIIDAKQQNALKLARSGQLNQAFEYVLSASDLNLVVYLCENLRPADIFSAQPCPLQIPVILSLIQQLAADLTTHQDLKYQ